MEIMSPAGSFDAAVQAFAFGADAVYTGLQRFSARNAAKNCSLEDIRRIKTLAVEQHKRLYIAVNTIIKEDELVDVVQMLHYLTLLEVDGIIVQDLGVAHIARKYFPELPLHSSTQLAVHNAEGVRYLHSIGFTRIVLARELTLEEIHRIRVECPEPELKVFIHGALCYSVSGLCLASGLLLGRSANRGLCGQVCRTWFSLHNGEDTDAPPNGYFFSMRDLALNEHIASLKTIGVDAVKIEGRMKTPEYSAWTSHHYRSLIDTGQSTDEEKTALTFSRMQNTGWSVGWKRPDLANSSDTLTSPAYPGHVGLLAGKVLASEHHSVQVQLTRPLAIRDGVQVFLPDTQHPGLLEPVAFAVRALEDKNRKVLLSADAGALVWISSPRRIPVGASVYITSRHDMGLPATNPASISPYRLPLSAQFAIGKRHISVSVKVEQISFHHEYTFDLTPEHANKSNPFREVLENHFSSSNRQFWFTISTELISNTSGYEDDRLFYPPKELKRLKHDLLASLQEQIEKHIEARSYQITAPRNKQPAQRAQLPPRSRITQTGTVFGDGVYLALPPLQLPGTASLKEIEFTLKRLRTDYPDKQIVVGISNVGQIPWYQKQEGIQCFIDGYLYCSNHATSELLRRELPDCLGGYYWPEESIGSEKLLSVPWSIPMQEVDRPAIYPLFISRSCFRRDSLNLPCSSCRHDKHHIYHLRQQQKTFTVVVDHCITSVYLEEENKP
ncbi:MAG: peptidase U32 family protein [Spirochaetota bacterium]